MAEWSLMLRFPEQHPAFSHGFEAGCLWQRLVQREVCISATIHDSNHGLVAMMAQHHGYALSCAESSNDGWIMATLTLPGAQPRTGFGETA